ncbi:hypothetical protein [Streptomyces regalis]|uniref:FlgD Ig-like domain-containing protein n=1 Tax=Streptomyces regalis TaxID=68262 RepID=A0A124G8I9_9ACTN|nr:hypothetical protein [Streptomyces regalis]KUL26080.1 hypothetical protein ADL12_33345 [Streptomyces regalis]
MGDQVLAGNPDFLPAGTQPALSARSLVTGAATTVLSPSFGGIGPTQDGGLATEKVAQIQPFAVGVQGLAVAGGELFLYGRTTGGGYPRFNSFQLDATGRPTGQQTPRSPALSEITCLTGDAACPQLEALGDGRVAYLWTNAEGQESVLTVGRDTTTIRNEPTGDAGGRIPGGSGHYVLHNGGSGTQKVVDFPSDTTDGETTLSRARTAAAVWGQVMWTPGSTQGAVVGKHLKTGQTVATIATGAPCTPTDLQAVNTWLYWSCGSTAGVYDRATGRRITVPADNGFLLRENRTTHELLLTDFHTGGSNGRWAVDRFGGHIAYLNGTYSEVSTVPSGVPASALAQTEAQTEAVPGGPAKSNPWQPVWQLNKPATWTLTLSNSGGTVVRALTGSTKGAAIRAAWDGYWGDGRRVIGTYTWKLTAEPRDNEGPALTTTDTTTVN